MPRSARVIPWALAMLFHVIATLYLIASAAGLVRIGLFPVACSCAARRSRAPRACYGCGSESANCAASGGIAFGAATT